MMLELWLLVVLRLVASLLKLLNVDALRRLLNGSRRAEDDAAAALALLVKQDVILLLLD